MELFSDLKYSKFFSKYNEFPQRKNLGNAPDMASKLSKIAISGHFHDFFYTEICYISKSIRSEKSAKGYFLQIKCWKYLYGRKAAHLDGTGV